MNESKFDVVVIGGGPGGYTAAIKASQAGLKVALIEKDKLGGICLNWGCIPTKALLKSAEIYNYIKKSNDFGISVQNIEYDFEKIIKRSRDVSSKLATGVEYLMKKNKINVIQGVASLKDKNTIIIKQQNQEAQATTSNIIIATGAEPRSIPGVEFNKNSIWNYKHAMTAERLPKSLLIIGSGAIGLEFADFYNTLGTKVTIVEKQPSILPGVDSEITEIMKKWLIKNNIEIFTNSYVENYTNKNKENTLIEIIDQKTKHNREFEKILVAIGIAPQVNALNLDKIGVITENGAIKINNNYQTNISNIYAIGDVTGGICLAHKASHDGLMCIEHIINKTTHRVDSYKIPKCIYTNLQIASIGKNEQELINEKIDYKIGKYNYRANGKAVASGETEGMIKVMFDKKTGELLGAHIIGNNATEIIHSYVSTMYAEGTDQTIQNSIFAHPTFSEMLHEAALDADKIAINQ